MKLIVIMTSEGHFVKISTPFQN